MNSKNILPLALMMTALPAVSQAAISYSTLGSLYSENFNSLPVDAPSAGNVQTSAYTNGWQDDSSTVAGDHFGVPGWYLYHPIAIAAEGGTNQHQRVRFGPGANTGSFWVFSSTAADTDKALGNVGSLNVAADGGNLYTAVRLTNNTGVPLTSFTLTFDGEQWRDGASTTGETLSFGYSTSATSSDWFDAGAFISVPTLSFTAPVTSGSGVAVNGNAAGLTSDITATVSGIDWQPGTDLWLRWADAQLAGNADDGIGIDNVRFTAVPEPCAPLLLAAAAAGLLSRRRTRIPVI